MSNFWFWAYYCIPYKHKREFLSFPQLPQGHYLQLIEMIGKSNTIYFSINHIKSWSTFYIYASGDSHILLVFSWASGIQAYELVQVYLVINLLTFF